MLNSLQFLELRMLSTSLYLLVGLFFILHKPVASDNLIYGEKCQFQNESIVCNVAMSLYCNATAEATMGVCRCPEHMYWDYSRVVGSQTGTCVTRVNNTCNTQPSDGSPQILCVKNASCRKVSTNVGKCFCNHGYQVTPDGDCLATFGGSCSQDSPCSYNAFLKCVKGSCTCDLENSTLQDWDNDKFQCISLHGGTCQPIEPDVRSCIPNADCNNMTMKCECKKDYTLNEHNRCVMPYNGNCEKTEDCDSSLTCILDNPTSSTTTSSTSPAPSVQTKTIDKSTTTKSSSRLANSKKKIPQSFDENAGVEGHCLCDSSSELYNTTTKQCQILVGHPCQTGKNCVDFALCSGGNCACSKSYLPTDDGKCAGGHGAICQVNGTDCYDKAYFSCTSLSTCDCMKGYMYHEESSKCIGFIGSSCENSDNCNATTTSCDPTSKKCQCNSGYTPFPSKATEYQFCLATFETNCSKLIQCNGAEFLSCVNGSCQCEVMTQKYNSTSHKCMALAGAKCDATVGPDCVKDSTCVSNKEKNINECVCLKGFYKTDMNFCESSTSSHLQYSMATIILAFIFIIKTTM